MFEFTSISDEPVGIIGAGAAGLVTAQVLLGDGFTNVQLVTRDESVGGIWAKERIYPGMFLNNVHGEFRFSAMKMERPPDAQQTGGLLTGNIMSNYMRDFSQEFIQDRVRFNSEVIRIRRGEKSPWIVTVEDVATNVREDLKFSRIVLCTGGCSSPKIPESLSLYAAEKARFRGLVLHSAEFGARLDDILAKVKAGTGAHTGSVVVVGGGKSAQEIAAYLANEGRKVTIVYDTTDAFIASSKPLPLCVRRSRLFSVLSPHSDINTRLERFLHKTWVGARCVDLAWNLIGQGSLSAYDIPADSPLRRTPSLFWKTRTNDEGVVRDNSFHSLVKEGIIKVVSPARALGYGDDGWTVVLSTGEYLPTDVVILATGYASSWSNIFDEETASNIGLDRRPPQTHAAESWDYTSLQNPPSTHPDTKFLASEWTSTIYRGLVPARNLPQRDFAINGAIHTTNSGYTFEVSAHWISSYFLGDKMRLPATQNDAILQAERHAAWLRKRYPGVLTTLNESNSAAVPYWSWPQAADEMLEDMYLPSMRSGGNWFTWPFKLIDSKELETLGQERRLRRQTGVVQP